MARKRDGAASDPQALPAIETAHMLKLCAAQIEGALSECDTAIAKLLESFGSLNDDAQWLAREATQKIESPDGLQAAPQEMTRRAVRLAAHANAALQALQFHDRLTQRLGHVRHSLESLSEFVTDPERNQREGDWQELHDRLGRMYRTREEVEIFTALSRARRPDSIPRTAAASPSPSGADIELF